MNLNHLGFNVAFGVIEYHKTVTLYDPNHVEWEVYMEEHKNLELVNKTRISTHECSEEDFSHFYPVQSA